MPEPEVRGVHQTAKISPKWHNRTTPHRMVQCGLRFYNKKIAQITLHRTLFIY